MIAPQSSIPTRVYLVDPLPQRCPNCGSRGLGVEAPIGSDLGRVVCALCSRQVCWLTTPPAAPPLVKLPRFVRRPTCSDACSALDGHDPEAHETAGYKDGYGAGYREGADAEESHARCHRIHPLALMGVVEIGPLRIDGDTRHAMLNGEPLGLSKREAQFLCALAARPGLPVLYRELAETIWGRLDDSHPQIKRKDEHHCRVVAVRLRAKLGDAAGLVETIEHLGYRLVTP